MLPLALLLGCPKKAPEPVVEEAPAFDRSVAPAPIARRDFTLPTPSVGALSNGVAVIVVENHELPFVQVRLVSQRGTATDPQGREGLGGATMDMLNEGTSEHTAVELSTELRKLGSSIGTSASLDSSSVRADTLARNLEPTLDLMAEILLEPTFPDTEWERIQKQTLQNLDAGRKDPSRISSRVFDNLMYGDAYDGRFSTADSISALDTDQMKAWYAAQFTPDQSAIFVGGDTTLDEITPLLEARFGSWEGTAKAFDQDVETKNPTERRLYVVDKPGASQSVVKVGRFVPARATDGYDDLYVANTVIGGMFMARLNMNLREDKGWTYGARTGVYAGKGDSVWMASTSVVSDQTGPAVAEILREVDSVAGEALITDDELAYFKGSRTLGYPGNFETVDYLLGQTAAVWLHDLPDDWLTSYVDRVDGVTLDGANAAFAEHVSGQPLTLLVVGDLATIREPLSEVGLPITVLDVEGDVVEDDPSTKE
ncbi:MAG: insulinase family protein [Proteobacteria bacterium]|nr:insulinase family protein [Pseudomonadota bacterium]MCP4917147.1 insulinase family protein [Pseudomonadota bacterium]